VQNFLTYTTTTSQDRSPLFQQIDASDDAFPFGSVPHAADEVEDDPRNAAHGEAVAEVVDDAVGAGLLSHRHGDSKQDYTDDIQHSLYPRCLLLHPQLYLVLRVRKGGLVFVRG
jgi:hypothetical protein